MTVKEAVAILSALPEQDTELFLLPFEENPKKFTCTRIEIWANTGEPQAVVLG